ncbi:major facilitator superfamily domain-containing protein [Flagelloscypha sp. PMI_526]|nr:major facilitator superfamily domain-containing protein [Flagelloscypha sp. PMI_526]
MAARLVKVKLDKVSSISEGSQEDVKDSATVHSIPPLGEPLESRKSFWGRTQRSPDLDAIATQPSVFDDPVSLETYRPPAAYENSHRFDPLARWTWREERAVVRKIDRKIMFFATLMFFCMDLDRSNISQANTDNLLKDLGVTTDDFNLGNALYKGCFLIAELPSQLISKRIGPDVWIPTQMVLWSIVSFSQFWIRNRAGFLATRCMLAFLQGGFIPDMVLFLSYFYKKNELPFRLTIFWTSNYLTDIVGAFLATGILKLRGRGGHYGWQYLFLIEGLATFVCGITAFFLMPPGPTQTKARWRPKGWFTEREETIIVNRVLRDDPSKSDMHNRQGLSPKMIWESLKDWHLWPIYALGATHMIPTNPPQTYMTLTLRNLGFSTTISNLLSIPAQSWFSEHIDSRVGATVILQFWMLPILAALTTFNKQTSHWAWWTLVTLAVGFPYVHPIQVAWASTNSFKVSTRTVSASVYNMFVQLAGIIASYVYRSDDAPYYHRGNKALLGVTCMNITLYALVWLFYRTVNKRREKKWNSWSEEERREYLKTTKDQGNKRVDFRFVY